MGAFSAALATLFADANMAETAAYHIQGTPPGVPVRVMRRRPDEDVNWGGGGRAVVETEILEVRVGDCPHLAAGDGFAFDDGQWLIVQGTPKRDVNRLLWTAEARPA